MNLDPRKIELKLPSVKRPSRKRSGGGLSESGFLGNVYADLRDRRLLVPLVVLAAAIIAVPVLLASDPAPAPAPAPPASLDDAAAVTPAVLVEAPGVRNYRKRLAALKKTNPFEQQFATVADDAEVEVETSTSDPSVSVAGEQVAETASASTSSGSASGEVSVSAEVVEPTDGSAGSPSTGPSGGAEVETESGESAEVSTQEPSLYTGTVDITFGTVGNAKRYRGVKRFDMLPDDKQPVIAFLGLSVDAKRAYFLVSSSVTETSGDGSCAPQKPAPCQILELEVGEQRTLIAGVEPVTYRLRVTDTDLEEISDPGAE